MLKPAGYAKDCVWLLENAGLAPRMIDHEPHAVGHYCPRSLSLQQSPSSLTKALENMEVGLWREGLVRAVRRQQSFMRQLVELHSLGATSAQLLANELYPYRSFMQAAASGSGNDSNGRWKLAVPCVTLDLIWHTHMLYPCNYARDCLAMCGTLIDHDDDSCSGDRH